MLPPRLIRRLVLAPLVIMLAVGFLVLSPFLALLARVFGLVARPRWVTCGACGWWASCWSSLSRRAWRCSCWRGCGW